MLRLRILSAAVALPLFLAAMFLFPNGVWSALMIVPLILAAREWGRLAGFDRAAACLFMALLILFCAFLLMAGGSDDIPRASKPAHFFDTLVYACGAVFWIVVAPCWLWLRIRARNRIALMFAGIVVLLPTWLALSRLQTAPQILLEVLLVIWISDSAAFFTGRAMGKRKLAPSISPGKTREGVGGAFVAVAVYAWLLHLSVMSSAQLPAMIAAFFGMTAAGIVGDLFESWLKRCAGVKDSGAIMPGHGGVLDRIDSLTAALPLAALIFN
jgi:phosphatidate cytidylyltransferase